MLINKLDIMDQKQLDENETLITSVKTLQIEMQPMTAEPDFAYLKHLHFVLFDELYSWAGEIRTINISKMRTAFCPADQVEATAQAILNDCRTVPTFADCRETSWSVSWPIFMTPSTICIHSAKEMAAYRDFTSGSLHSGSIIA